VLCCVLKWCTVTCTHIWVVLTVNCWFRFKFAFCYFCHFILVLFAFVVLDLVSSVQSQKNWLGRTSSKWPILCWVACENLNSINQANLFASQMPCLLPNCYYFHLMAIFQMNLVGQFSFTCSGREPLEIYGSWFLRGVCSSWHPAISVKITEGKTIGFLRP